MSHNYTNAINEKKPEVYFSKYYKFFNKLLMTSTLSSIILSTIMNNSIIANFLMCFTLLILLYNQANRCFYCIEFTDNNKIFLNLLLNLRIAQLFFDMPEFVNLVEQILYILYFKLFNNVKHYN